MNRTVNRAQLTATMLLVLLSTSFLPLIVSSVPMAQAETLGAWSSTSSLAEPVYGLSCITSEGYIYCVGGHNPAVSHDVEYAPISSSGAGHWSFTTNYPLYVSYLSCATSGAYIYCVGGNTLQGDTTGVYYASISSSGVGAWNSTTSYP